MDIYIIDTSSLIEMKNKYPKDTFPTVWQKVNELCSKKRLIAPDEVRKEIERGDDELKRWARTRRKIFIKPNKYQCSEASEILKSYPSLAKPEQTGPNADPWIIALALEKISKEKSSLFQQNKYIVVTEESRIRQNRIPAICQNYNIECINLIELFRREGWKF